MRLAIGQAQQRWRVERLLPARADQLDGHGHRVDHDGCRVVDGQAVQIRSAQIASGAQRNLGFYAGCVQLKIAEIKATA